MRYDLDNYEQAQTLMKSVWPKVREALVYGRKLTLEIKPASKSREQEEKYHAIIGDIAKQAQHMGAKWDAETWKRLLVDKYVREIGLTSKIMANLDNDGLVQLGFQTRKFTKEQASEFVAFLICWCDQNGIELNDDSKI
jgi:hypothetical protein